MKHLGMLHTHSDRYGLPLATASDAAASAYRDGIDLMLSAWPGADAAFDRAIALDPGFALAHAARARVHQSYAQPVKAKAAIAEARRLAHHANARDQSHVLTLALAIDGQSERALAAALSHLSDWPTDAVIMSLPLGAFGLFAFSGRADHNQARVDLCDRYAQHYGDDWWFSGYRGWSHTENGNMGLGRDLTERALAMRPANANAAHALAHAMFEAGATGEADAFITKWLPSYDRRGILHAHIWWHQALAGLEQGDTARALAIYTDHLAPAVTAAVPLNAMSDCASLLWRLQLSETPVPQRLWRDVAAYADAAFPRTGVTFADVHMAMIDAATGNRAAAAARIDALQQRLADTTLTAGPVVIAISRATHAFAEGDYAECVRLLEPVAADVVRIGGSHAQREIFEDMLLVAHLNCGHRDAALAILDRRLHHTSSARDGYWRRTATAIA